MLKYFLILIPFFLPTLAFADTFCQTTGDTIYWNMFDVTHGQAYDGGFTGCDTFFSALHAGDQVVVSGSFNNDGNYTLSVYNFPFNPIFNEAVNTDSGHTQVITFTHPASSTGPEATSTIEQAQQNLFNGMVLYLGGMFFVVWFFKRVVSEK